MASEFRLERDTMGEVRIPAARLWGAQTQRSLENFRVGEERMPREIIGALMLVKKAAAQANAELGVLDGRIAAAIVSAADEVLAGRHDGEFPLVVWQTGSGTQTNMNGNEVLANRASEILGGARGAERLVHPNDHCNRSQSSNDVFSTAMSVAAVKILKEKLLPAVARLRDAWADKARAFRHVVKIGRTHLQDAVPLTLGQEFSGYASMLEHAAAHVEACLPHLSELAIGGTAVGTGLNAPPEFAARVVQNLRAETGRPFREAPNKFEALAAKDAFVHAHGTLKALACSLFKIAGDVRWAASGPRCGLGEIFIPENEPGSSLMPGKVNPTQCEMLTMVCAQVLGHDAALSVGGAGGRFELNVFMPLIARNFLHSARLLADGCESFREHCVTGIEPNLKQIAAHVQNSLMLVTALNPHLGYERAAEIAQYAQRTGKTLREAAQELGGVQPADFDRWVCPEKMVGPLPENGGEGGIRTLGTP